MIADQILPHLNKVKQTGEGRWVACCCCHEEKTPSLTITEKQGFVLIHCFGCGANGKDVCEALDLHPMILFGEDYKPGENRNTTPPYADILRCLKFDVTFLVLCAKEIRQGKTLCDSDTNKLNEVYVRTQSAVRAAGL